MTPEQWLKIPEQDLPVKLAEVLLAGQGEHRYEYGGQCTWGNPDREGPPKWRHCKKCDKWRHRKQEEDLWSDEPCPVPDHIDIKDRNAAVQLIRKLFVTPKQQTDFIIELTDICDEAPVDYLDGDPDFMLWLLFIANARELLIAAAMTVEGKQE